MKKITDDELWSIINRLAEREPDRTEGLVNAIFIELGYSERQRRRYLTLLDVRQRRPDWLRTLGTAWAISHRFDPHGPFLLGYVMGYEARGGSWREIAEEASASFELHVVEYDYELSQWLKDNAWRR